MGWLTRLGIRIAPQWTLKRQVARLRMGAYGSGYSRHGGGWKTAIAGWDSAPGSPDKDTTKNLKKLRARSRDLYMGSPLATGALKTINVNEIGPGLKLNPNIDASFLGLTRDEAQEWERNVKREWDLWARSKMCDARRQLTFGQMQGLARLSQMMSGDCFALFTLQDHPGDRYRLKVKLVEGDFCGTPVTDATNRDIMGGVEFGTGEKVEAYWFRSRHPEGVQNIHYKPDSWTRLPAFGAETGRPNLLHIMQQERPGQRRGMPLLAPVIETVKQLSRYTDAEVSAAVIDSFFAAAVSSKAGEPTIEPAMTEDEQIDGSNDNTLELANGTILELNEGEEITPINPSRPNNAFDGFVLSLSRYIGSAIGLPFELLVKHFTASYSASRAALLEAWKGFRVGREFMIENFCQPVYEQWLAEAVAMGHVSAPGFWGSPLAQAAWTRAQWHGPSQGQLDPLKEVKAAEQRVSGGFSTRTREAAELTGTDWEENHKVRDREENLRRSAGLTERPEPDTTGDEGSPDEPHRRE